MTAVDGSLLDAASVSAAVRAYGLVSPRANIDVSPLQGGVSSLVFRVTTTDDCFVVKQALGQLRVSQEWFVSLRRSATEASCAALLAEIVPGSVPRPLYVDSERHAFVMECAASDSVTWKSQLLAGHHDQLVARRVGRLLGAIHGRTAGDSRVESQFGDKTLFVQLRIDPYFAATAQRYPSLGLLQLSDDLLTRCECLVHGDFSPKNLLVGPDGHVVLVDHEVAHFGDPAFDVAFVVSHLVLKMVHRPQSGLRLWGVIEDLVSAYLAEAGPVGAAAMPRVPALIAALMLARVDGVSPVEYLDSPEQDRVRAVAQAVLVDAPRSIAAIRTHMGALK